MASIEYAKKVLVIGDVSVGKTSFVRRMADGRFTGEYIKDTVGTNCVSKTILKGDVQVVISLWDIAGQERFRSLMNTFARGTAGIIIMCDVTREATLEGAKLWKHSVDDQLDPCPPSILLVNKYDYERKYHSITPEQIKQFVSKHKTKGSYQISVKENINIDSALDGLADLLLQSPVDRYHDEDTIAVDYHSKKKESCC